MKLKKDETAVVFRMYKDHGVIALFPLIEEGPGLCGSYQHVGQHGATQYSGVIASTRAATPFEYAVLKTELERAPYEYKFKVYKRMPPRRRISR